MDVELLGCHGLRVQRKFINDFGGHLHSFLYKHTEIKYNTFTTSNESKQMKINIHLKTWCTQMFIEALLITTKTEKIQESFIWWIDSDKSHR